MTTYIVNITKPLNHITKVEVEGENKQQIIDLCETQFGSGITPFDEKDLILKSDLPLNEQSFFYEKVNIHEKFFILQ